MQNVPNLPPPGEFQNRIVSLNNLDTANFSEWVFLPSMLYRGEDKWWGNLGKRDTPHEGIDLCFFRDSKGTIRHLDAGHKVPATFPGRVIRVINDFLGFSVFLCHDVYHDGENRLFTIYGHTSPAPGIEEGAEVKANDVIGTIADAKKTRASVRSHLHISVGWIPDSLPVETYTWDTLADPEKVRLLDPNKVLGLPFTVVESV